MKKSYNFATIYPNNKEELPIRQVLKDYLIPKKWQHFLRINQELTINGEYRSFNNSIKPGEKINFTFSEFDEDEQVYLSSDNDPKIIFEDENVIVIDKPNGQKSHPNLPTENNSAMNDAANYLAKTNQKPFMVHRLDMLTRGLMLIAKNPVVVPILNRQLVNKTMQRFYFADVNLLKHLEKSGSINQPIGPDDTDKRKRKVRIDGLASVTHYTVISNKQSTARLNLSLETGRTHQIRVHLASIGAPIIGDPLYNPLYQEYQNLELTAYKMIFTKPFSFEQQIIELPHE